MEIQSNEYPRPFLKHGALNVITVCVAKREYQATEQLHGKKKPTGIRKKHVIRKV